MGLDGENALPKLKHLEDCVNSRADLKVLYPCAKGETILLHNLARVEHERWIASHKLMGYTYHSDNDCVQKHSKYICPWEELDECTKSYDCNVVDTTIRLACRKG